MVVQRLLAGPRRGLSGTPETPALEFAVARVRQGGVYQHGVAGAVDREAPAVEEDVDVGSKEETIRHAVRLGTEVTADVRRLQYGTNVAARDGASTLIRVEHSPPKLRLAFSLRWHSS